MKAYVGELQMRVHCDLQSHLSRSCFDTSLYLFPLLSQSSHVIEYEIPCKSNQTSGACALGKTSCLRVIGFFQVAAISIESGHRSAEQEAGDVIDYPQPYAF